MSQLRVDGADGARRSASTRMNRLRRFPDNRFIGRRDEMVVYDCDDPGHFALLSGAVAELSLDMNNRLQSFAPDTADEALNRGFASVHPPEAIAP